MTSGSDDALATHELDLVTRASKGDAEAFDRFYERNAAGVQLLVERLLGPGPMADTVVLEAFEKTVRGSRSSARALLAAPVRAHHARNGAYAALGRDRPEAPKGPVAALLSLPSRQRELLALRELGLSEAQCAEVAGIEPAEVGVQVARGRLRLTDALEDASLSGVFAEPRAERLLAAPRWCARTARACRPSSSRRRPPLPTPTPASPRRSRPSASRRGRSASCRPPPVRAGSVPSRATASSVPRPVRPVPQHSARAPRRPPRRPRRRARPRHEDPYDAEIGEEAAWGIVDDDELEEPAAPPPAPPADGPEPNGAPNREAWDAGTPQAPHRFRRGTAAATPADPTPADPPLDELAGWDTLDWDEDDKHWTAGPDAAPPAVAPVPGRRRTVAAPDDPTAGAPIAAAPGAIDPELTAPLRCRRRGLADPDDDATAVAAIAPGPPAAFDFGGGDGDEPGRGRATLPVEIHPLDHRLRVLFAGVAFAAYIVEGGARTTPTRRPPRR